MRNWNAGYLHRVGSPDKEGEASNGAEEGSHLVALLHGGGTAVGSEKVDDDKVGDAGNSIPSPLVGLILLAESSEETGKDHDDVGNNNDKDVGAVHASKKSQVKKEKRGGQAPVDVTGPVNLTEEVVV